MATFSLFFRLQTIFFCFIYEVEEKKELAKKKSVLLNCVLSLSPYLTSIVQQKHFVVVVLCKKKSKGGHLRAETSECISVFGMNERKKKL